MIPRHWRKWHHLGALLLVVLAVATGVGAQGFAPTSSVSGGSSSSTSIVHQATVTLIDAQIKALPTTPFTLVATPGSGKTYILLYAHLRVSAAVDYTNIDGTATIAVKVGDSMGIIDNTVASSVSQLLAGGDPADATNAQLTFRQRVNSTATLGISGRYDSDIASKAMTLFVANAAAGNFTGGDGANSMIVSVTYLILDLTMGVFE